MSCVDIVMAPFSWVEAMDVVPVKDPLVLDGLENISQTLILAGGLSLDIYSGYIGQTKVAIKYPLDEDDFEPEIRFGHLLYERGLGPRPVARFNGGHPSMGIEYQRQKGMAFEFIEGTAFKWAVLRPVQENIYGAQSYEELISILGNMTDVQDNFLSATQAFVERVNYQTITRLEEMIEFVRMYRIEVDDFQFLIQEDGNIWVIDSARYRFFNEIESMESQFRTSIAGLNHILSFAMQVVALKASAGML